MRAGHKRIVLVAPTGSGKTTIAAAAIDSAVNRGRRVLFLAHRDELIAQCSQRLAEHGLPHGIIKAGWGGGDLWPVQVASVQTLVRRSGPPSNLLVVDECHRTLAETYLKILDRYPEATVIGLSATPYRTDNRGLGDVYTDLVEVATPSQLIELGFLLRPRIFAPSTPDLTGVHTSRGDFDQRELGLAMDNARLVGNIVEHWGKLARGRRTVLFATTVAHSEHLVAALAGAGARAAHLDANTRSDQRARILEQLAAGDLDVVSNVGILTEGWDLPKLSAAIMARPTQSEALYLQMLGRVMRTDPGKPDAIVIDHAGNVYRHGFPWEPREWSLDGKAKREKTEAQVKTCLQCYALVPSNASVCPECGAGFGTAPRENPEEAAGELVEIHDLPPEVARPERPARGGKAVITSKSVSLATVQQRQEYLAWAAEATSKGWAPGYASVRFKQKYGYWPSKQFIESATPAQPAPGGLIARGTGA